MGPALQVNAPVPAQNRHLPVKRSCFQLAGSPLGSVVTGTFMVELLFSLFSYLAFLILKNEGIVRANRPEIFITIQKTLKTIAGEAERVRGERGRA